MGLRLKFNLILLLVFSAGYLTVGVVAQRYLERQAIDDAERAALLTLDAAVIGNIDVRTATAMGSRLVDMKVREFPADKIQSGVEGEAIARFKNGSNNQVADIFTSSTGEKRLVIARKLSGAPGGDGIAKFRVATIDLIPVLATMKTALVTLLSSLGAVFFAVFFVLNLMLDRMIVRPVAEMARQADAVSVGDFSIPEFKPDTSDEVGVLAVAFNRMRRSTEEAIQLLKSEG